MLLLCSCLPPQYRSSSGPLAEPARDPNRPARLSAFLTLENPQGPAVRLEIDRIEVLANGLWLPVSAEKQILDSREIGAGQVFLGSQPMSEGRYRSLRFTVNRGEFRAAGGDYIVIAPEPFQVVVDLAAELALERGDSGCLLLSWDVEDSLRPDHTLRPELTAAPPLKQMPIDLIFASCPEIDTVFVIRADKNWVIDSFGVEGGPTYLAVHPDPSRQRLFVLAARERTIKEVDLSSYRVVDFFPAPLNDVPTFMTIHPDGRSVFLLDERSGYLSRMDLGTGRSAVRVLLGNRPLYALFLAERNQVAVTTFLSQKVLLLDPETLRQTSSFSVGSSPQGLGVLDEQLYVAEFGDHTVSISDLDVPADQSRVAVGLGPWRVLGVENQVYVSNTLDGSLSVLVPGQLGVSQEIFGFDRPREMALNQFYRRLYVADEGAGALAVIDVNTNLLLDQIVLGARPFGLAALQ